MTIKLNNINNFKKAVMGNEELEEEVNYQLNELGNTLWHCSDCDKVVEMDNNECCEECGSRYLTN